MLTARNLLYSTPLSRCQWTAASVLTLSHLSPSKGLLHRAVDAITPELTAAFLLAAVSGRAGGSEVPTGAASCGARDDRSQDAAAALESGTDRAANFEEQATDTEARAVLHALVRGVAWRPHEPRLRSALPLWRLPLHESVSSLNLTIHDALRDIGVATRSTESLWRAVCEREPIPGAARSATAASGTAEPVGAYQDVYRGPPRPCALLRTRVEQVNDADHDSAVQSAWHAISSQILERLPDTLRDMRSHMASHLTELRRMREQRLQWHDTT